MEIRDSDKCGAPTDKCEPDRGHEAELFQSRDARFQALLETARRAAVSDATILITGESGTGKAVLARQIHRWSARRERPYVVVNCATLTEQLAENELFGHVRGAFTGAVSDKAGRFETADGGTIYFDEVTELRPVLQAKLLRFIEERSFERVGGTRTVKVDVRIVAATAHNLEAEVAGGRFREDLQYRLKVIELVLPPLRERSADILILAKCMLREISQKMPRPELDLSPAAVEALASYRWPGNLRELHNALERAAILSRNEVITAEDLPENIYKCRVPLHASCASATRLKDVEREHILRALAESRTLANAAGALGINVTTLWRKRKRYGLI